jgi:hypothetical protein
MTDQTIIQIPKSYAKGNTRQVGATYVDSVDLTDPNVKIFQYDPVAKTYGRTIVTNQPSIARSGKTSYKLYERPSKQSSIASSSSGTELATPMEAIEEIKKGRAMAGSFFKHPVVKESYAHNQKLAKRLGLDLPDRPADISDMVTRPVKVG